MTAGDMTGRIEVFAAVAPRPETTTAKNAKLSDKTLYSIVRKKRRK
jgi:hypothetical protein